jgi:hypothetical protein
MRKSLLALSIAALVGGAANAAVFEATGNATVAHPSGLAPATALTVSTTGVGHILTVPYFTTQGTNKTLLNIVNTDTVNGKAVKLRFRGATNSDDIFDITIFLSPGDMWTADVAADASGVSRLVTNDTSCTLPYKEDIKALGGKFKTNRVIDGAAAQTREGYIEILNTADIPATLVTAVTGAVGTTANPLFTATKHATSGATAGTPTCATATLDLQENDIQSFAAATPNSWHTRGYNYPSGGLMANWTVVNVAGFASFSGTATAVAANGTANIVVFPQTDAAQAATNLTADPLLVTGRVSSAMYDFPDLSTPYIAAVAAGAAATQADTLTQALATTSVTNEFLTGSGFSTDWVFSQPTRRYHVAVDYAATGANRLVFRDGTATTSGTGTGYFAATNTRLNVAGQITGAAANSVACVTPGQLRAYNREELTRSTFVISPATALNLCGEVSVLSFNNAGESVLNGALTRNNLETGTGLVEGWFRVATPSAVALAAPAVSGLPIIGYSAAKVSGVNLGGAWTHRTAR